MAQDPKKETKKEETMRRTGMTSEAYDKIHKGYELTQPENYKKVKDAIDSRDKKIIEERNKAKPVKKKLGGKVKGYKDGGKVKKCRMDGIALRGKTRAKQRSK